MIDYLLNFASVQEAKNDPVLSRHMDQLQAWSGSYVFPDLKSWRVSQDHSIGNDENGQPMIVHAYRTGWTIMISMPERTLALQMHPNLIVAIDRDAVEHNRAGMIMKANVTQAVMQDTRWEPVPAGVEYPWGNWR